MGSHPLDAAMAEIKFSTKGGFLVDFFLTNGIYKNFGEKTVFYVYTKCQKFKISINFLVNV